jgi:NitT/TauT family transport system permease protein
MTVVTDTTLAGPDSVQAAAPRRNKGIFDAENAISVNLGRVLLIGSLLALWEIGANWFFDPFFFSKPSLVAVKFMQELMTPSLYYDAYVTGVELLFGYAGGAIAGIVLGVLLANWLFVAKIFDPLLLALNAIPRIAIAPMLIVWFGIGMASKIFLAATLVFFITFFNTHAGVRSVDRALLNVARVQGANGWQLFTKVVVPSASSWIITGLKMSLPFALAGVIFGEFLVASEGLGYRLNHYSTSYDTTGGIAMILLMMLIMMVLTSLADRVENWLLRWRPKSDDSAGATPRA